MGHKAFKSTNSQISRNNNNNTNLSQEKRNSEPSQILQFKFNSKNNIWEEYNGEYVKLEQNSIKIISYNTWFKKFHFEERTQSLIEILKTEKAHVVGFQEIIKDFITYIKKDPWVQENCFLSDIDGSTFQGYGVMFISIIPFETLYLLPLPDAKSPQSQLRKIIYGKIEFSNGESLVIGNAHLQSYDRSYNIRNEQVEKIGIVLSKFENWVFIADTNFEREYDVPDEKHHSIFQKYGAYDIWLTLGHKTGWTFDTKINLMTKNSTNVTDLNPIRKRIDRAFLSSTLFKPDLMNIIGMNPLQEESQLWTSDHFGISFTLKCSKEEEKSLSSLEEK